eukprot:Skav235512  [mRNA]  locus=scaffold625:622163:623961:- [translate_table: standard]
MSPPWQPSFPKLPEQSTNCCSDKETNVPVAMAHAPSKAPVELNAQQEPHCCWFFTGVTTPSVLQSTEPGREMFLT